MPRSVVIHGHYYQPPREEPWLEEIQRQPTAAPFHDWNERIDSECYRAIIAARVLDADGRIARILNTLAYTSFNFGPTLLAWLERASPETYNAVREADRASAVRLGGHGNAMAQAYHHTILPLASRRDKITEVRWGIADFCDCFGRQPEGMWLPETAVDDETLDVLAQEGIRYTILAPHQVTAPPARGLPGLYRTSNGREIAIFVYDGPLSHGIAFGDLLRDGGAWAARLTDGLVEAGSAAKSSDLLAMATDGETYGHHHCFGEMALATVIDTLERRRDVRIENFASFLARNPARTPVSLVSPSAWSCAHGVERWRADCGCGASTTSPSQSWRAPFREAIQALADDLHVIFERDAKAYFFDPWEARNAYVPSRPGERSTGTERTLDVRARELLELERNALQLFTSCAWFFDDVDRLEPLQIMRYAARAIDLAGAEGPALEEQLLVRLAEARSSDPDAGTARDIYLRSAKPHVSPYARIAAAQALRRALGVSEACINFRCCIIEDDVDTVVVRECRTGWEHMFNVSVLLQGAADDGLLRRARHAVVRVHSAGTPVDSMLSLMIDDVPESARLALEIALRQCITTDSLDSASLANVAEGVDLFDVVPRALLHAVNALGTDRGWRAVARVLDLLDLADDVGVVNLFEAQNSFARIRADFAGAPMLLAPIAHRLGFAAPARPAPVTVPHG